MLSQNSGKHITKANGVFINETEGLQIDSHRDKDTGSGQEGSRGQSLWPVQFGVCSPPSTGVCSWAWSL